jgi:uncharacterized protein YegL
MKDNSTLIACLLDRSGSMESIKTDSIGGFNKFISEQKKITGECLISLYQFDDKYDVVYENKDIKEVKDLELVPRGWTALLDAIGNTINRVGDSLNKLSEKDKPSKIIFVIITDGQENSSKEFNVSKIKEMVEHQTNKYSWNFVFLGANMDAIKVAGSYGISRGSTMCYAASSVGTSNVYDSLSTNICNFRSNTSKNISFSDEDRKKQEEELNKTLNK